MHEDDMNLGVLGEAGAQRLSTVVSGSAAEQAAAQQDALA
jgi:hypothetical protein